MQKQFMPNGILAGHTAGQLANINPDNMEGAIHPSRMAAPTAQRKLEFDFSDNSENPNENFPSTITATQIDTKISTLRDSMLCTVEYTVLHNKMIRFL
jgi:hypothetical protein